MPDKTGETSPEKIKNIVSLEATQKFKQVDGVLVLNKPQGPTSAACISVIKRRLGQKKIGHAGTLDPMATGVLLILLGQGTKISGHLLSAGEKIYSGTVKFGISTNTWDAEGEIISENNPSAVNEIELLSAIKGWIGKSEQEVPPYSAAKYKGRPLYELARKGLETPVKIKTIKISRAELEWFKPPLARFRVACSSGTYIRSLAHSLGIRFGCGATLMELTREYSHPFGLEQAVTLDELLANPDILRQKVQSLPAALPDFAVINLEPALAIRIKHGNQLPVSAVPSTPAEQAILMENGNIPLALVKRKLHQGQEIWHIERGLWNS